MYKENDLRRKDELADYLYHKWYIGKQMSLAQIANRSNRTRQSVFSLFENRGFHLRTKKLLPTQEFMGVKFSPMKNGYLRRTDGDRCLMHRFVWQTYRGEIPDAHDIHHKNEIKTDNRIANLELISKAEHTRKHRYKPHKEKYCKQCDLRMLRHDGEGFAAYGKRNFCGKPCSWKWRKGKPRGMKANA
mgnify:CR=1 FL=1